VGAAIKDAAVLSLRSVITYWSARYSTSADWRCAPLGRLRRIASRPLPL
jgi:hypothetical protein